MKLEQLLNKLLGSMAVYYQNVKGFHWLIRGKDFFDLHAKYGELYECADEHIDEIAERILQIGGIPIHTYEDFTSKSLVPAEKNIYRNIKGVDITIKNLRKLVMIEKEIIAEADKDEATKDMMIKLIAEQEKQIWMLDSWLS